MEGALHLLRDDALLFVDVSPNRYVQVTGGLQDFPRDQARAAAHVHELARAVGLVDEVGHHVCHVLPLGVPRYAQGVTGNAMLNGAVVARVEYLAILEVKFGKDIYKNRDLYSFLIHLAEKDHYDIGVMIDSQETFLEEIVVHYLEPALSDYKDLSFKVEYGEKEIELIFGEDEVAALSELTFVEGD